MALPLKREDLCTLFWLPLLTPPASPVMRKMVLEYHFDHFILLLSAALIRASVQSVGPNPLMNVFFWGFTWQHIPNSGQWTAGWLWRRVFYFIPHCQMFVFAKHNLSLYISGMAESANWRLTKERKSNQLLDRHQFSSSLITDHKSYTGNFLLVFLRFWMTYNTFDSFIWEWTGLHLKIGFD